MPWVPSVEQVRSEREHALQPTRTRLRDEFALAAMREYIRLGLNPNKGDAIAMLAYRQADAMIAARERKESSNG
jgi:hypothetical protein